MVIPVNLKGIARSSRLSDSEVQWFSFDPAQCDAILTLNERRTFEEMLAREQRLMHFPVGSSPLCATFELISSDMEAPSFIQRARMLQIVAACFHDRLSDQKYQEDSSTSAASKLRRFADRLTLEELAQTPPGELAERCGCSLRHLLRLFHQEFGTSYRSYLTGIRLERARRLIEETGDEPEIISQQTGFQSHRVFSAQFRRRFGVTPSALKKSALANRAVRVP